MTRQANQCKQLPLAQLLANGEGEASREMVDHLDHCPTCRSRLAELAADSTWWTETRESLSGVDEFPWKPDPSWSSCLPYAPLADRNERDSLVRKLLAPPSHPELLGRLVLQR